MDPGFASRNTGLSHIAPEKFERFAFLDEDVAEAGLREFIPWKGECFRSYLCRACELYLIDYGTSLSRAQADGIAKSLTPEK